MNNTFFRYRYRHQYPVITRTFEKPLPPKMTRAAPYPRAVFLWSGVLLAQSRACNQAKRTYSFEHDPIRTKSHTEKMGGLLLLLLMSISLWSEQTRIENNVLNDLSNKPFNGLLPVIDASRQFSNCDRKMQGVSAGKICSFNQKRYYLKVAEGIADQETATFLSLYNFALIKRTLFATTPKTSMLFEKDGKYLSDTAEERSAQYYLASEQVDGFVSAIALFKQAHRRAVKTNRSFKVVKRELVIDKLSEVGLAQLAVAGTFFQDLVMNDGNWGYNANGLVIIDVDHSPNSFEVYLSEASRMPLNIEIEFSLNTMWAIKKIYENMLTLSPPKLYAQVDMSESFYKQLVSTYLTACNSALEKIKTDIPSRASPEINQHFADSLLEQLILLRQSDISSETVARYRP